MIAFSVSLISYLIYQPYLYIYPNYINPEWFAAVLKLNEEALSTASIPGNEIQCMLEKQKASNTSQSVVYRLSTFVSSVIVVPLMVVLVSVLFINNKPNTDE